MALNTNINLDKPNSKKDTLILHSVTTGKIRFRINSGHKVLPSDFDKVAQKVKKKAPGAENLNALLEKQQAQIKDACRVLAYNGKDVTKDNVLSMLPFVLKEKRLTVSFENVYTEWLYSSKKRVASSTITAYNTTLKHLKAFSTRNNFILSFENMNVSFYDAFTGYLYDDVQCYDNYAGKIIRNLKTFLYWAKEKKYHFGSEFEKWKALEEKDKDPVCLLQEELKHLEDYIPPTESLSKVRDLFLLLCYTGMRFSDMQNLKKENIVSKNIGIVTLKTRQKINIPLIPKALAIIEKYLVEERNTLPKISNQKMNDYLKELFQLAGLNRPIQKIKLRGSYRKQEAFPLYEVISSHAGRHTFATISLMIGIDAETVKAITGHKKHETFKRYLHLTDKFKSEKMKLWETI